MFAWLAYTVRMVAALVMSGGAVLLGITSVFGPDRNPVVMAVAGIFAGAAFWCWPRRPNAWRRDPPTERQLSYARNLGIDVPPGSSKGEVSDMISRITGR